jgi:ABC-type cobalamin/Fe3+-siderophores transport system ATPase subunit
LDFKNQSLVLTIIKRLAQTGISIILSTHLPNHALLYASRVALMEDGRFLAFGRPEEVMTSENLRNTYGIEVKVLSVNDPQTGNNLRYVIPAEETKVIKCDKHVFPPAG